MRRSLPVSGAGAVAIAIATAIAQDAVFTSDVRLVQLYATVFDKKGRYLDDIGRERFVILDNGLPQQIIAFQPEESALACAVLLDTTASMTNTLPAVKNGVSGLIDELRAEDSIAVYGFSTQLNLLQDFTHDKEVAKRAVLRTRAGGRTALFDAIAQVAHDIAPRGGKKAIIVFTDGDDNASALSMNAAVTRVKRTGVPVYTIAEGEALTKPGMLKALRNIAESSGATFHEAKRSKAIGAIFDEIANDLRHGYLIAYKPAPDTSGRWHALRLQVDGVKECSIRAKDGYYAE